MLERLLEELDRVNKDGLLGLLLDDEIDDFEAEVGAGPRRQVDAFDQFLVLFLDVVLVDVDDCSQKAVQPLSRVQVFGLQLATQPHRGRRQVE